MSSQVFEKVKAIIADALNVELDEVKQESVLMNDLGAESIDFLDIVFRLEQEFDIKIPKGAIEKKARGNLSEEEFAINGLIQDKGLAQLKLAMPEVCQSDIQTGLSVRDIPSLFTVQTFENLVLDELAPKPQYVQSTTHTHPVELR